MPLIADEFPSKLMTLSAHRGGGISVHRSDSHAEQFTAFVDYQGHLGSKEPADLREADLRVVLKHTIPSDSNSPPHLERRWVNDGEPRGLTIC